MRPVRIITAFVFAAAVAVAGCTAHSTTAHPAPATATPVTTGPYFSPASEPRIDLGGPTDDTTPREPVVLVDGRHPVIVKTVDPDRRTISFDLIQFYQGEDAIREAAKDHQESPPPNDYYIRNTNPKLRTLPVRSDATITTNTLTAGYTGSATKNVRIPLDRLAIVLPRGGAGPFWITVRHDQVVKVAEQYVP